MKYIYLLLSLFILGCSAKNNNDNKAENKGTIQERPLVLFEDSINGIGLPFKRVNMESTLKDAFRNFVVSKEIGQQDGPNFPLFSVKKEKDEILFFSMDDEDTLKLNEVTVKSDKVTDMYGIKVGDTYTQIKSKRKGNVKTYTDLEQSTYAYVDNSNILYIISGEANIPEDADMEHLKFTDAQLKDWKVEYILWRKK